MFKPRSTALYSSRSHRPMALREPFLRLRAPLSPAEARPQACSLWLPPYWASDAHWTRWLYLLVGSFIFGKLGNSHLAPCC